ncbi:MAG TPA: metal-dependent hydrolase [Candidatus Xenobia bacterium]|jgi:hypothetical protein
MSPFTHLFATWVVADAAGLKGRERAVVAWCGVLPDLDGLGALVDIATHGRTDWYTAYHHVLLHGLFGALLISTLLLPWARRLGVWLGCVLAIHGHLLCDLVGSRGPLGEIWPIYYLGPFSLTPGWSLSWQWALNGWQNVLFTVLLMIWIFRQAIVAGESPVSLVSRPADRVFVSSLRARFLRPEARPLEKNL